MSLYAGYGNFLEDKGIRASSQRILMLEYLKDNYKHPTADKIYTDLSSRLPSISKATVYNNLKLFLNKGIIKEINLDNNEVHYEVKMDDHVHFICKQCGKIEDVDLIDLNFDTKKISNYEILSRDIILKGTCSDCLEG